MVNANLQQSPAEMREGKTETLRLGLLAGSIFLAAIGVMMFVFGLAYIRDLDMLRNLPNLIWNFICGTPLDNEITLPLLMTISLASLLSSAGLGAWFWWLGRGKRKRSSPEHSSSNETELPETHHSGRTALFILIGSTLVTLILVFTVVPAWLQNAIPATNPVQIVRTDGVRPLSTPREVTDFTLPSHAGDPVSLSDFRGQYVLLYFGYTHCPDVCLLTLNDIRALRERLGDQAARMVPVFISVDGERDTPAILSRYFGQRNVDDFMVGLSGDETTLKQISPDYSLQYQLNDDADQNGNYSVDHTASLYLIDPEGSLTTIFAYGTQPEIMADYLSEQFAAHNP